MSQKVADQKNKYKILEWKTRPHLTLVCFNNVDEKICIEKLKNFAECHKPIFSVNLS